MTEYKSFSQRCRVQFDGEILTVRKYRATRDIHISDIKGVMKERGRAEFIVHGEDVNETVKGTSQRNKENIKNLRVILWPFWKRQEAQAVVEAVEAGIRAQRAANA